MDHYIDNILPNGFKAQVVCSSKMAAVKYKKHIDKAVADGWPQEAGQSRVLDRRSSCRSARRRTESHVSRR